MTICIACGMPMEKKEDFAMGDVSKKYCVHCARPDGSMQNYDEKLEGLIAFIVRTQGFDTTAAKNAAVGMMLKLPAWRHEAAKV